MKSGLVHPVPKKGKNAKRPDSYRRITVTSIVGKVPGFSENKLWAYSRKIAPISGSYFFSP